MKTILVVEDEPSIAQIAADYLRHGGFGVITASNGVDALAQARAQRPDLVVLDLGLPRLDGLEVAKTLRREGDVPIIMLTARIDEADRLAGLELGAGLAVFGVVLGADGERCEHEARREQAQDA